MRPRLRRPTMTPPSTDPRPENGGPHYVPAHVSRMWDAAYTDTPAWEIGRAQEVRDRLHACFGRTDGWWCEIDEVDRRIIFQSWRECPHPSHLRSP